MKRNMQEKKHRSILKTVVLLLLCSLVWLHCAEQAANASLFLPAESEILQIAEEAYEYALPLVLMDLTMKNGTNIKPTGASAPVNQFFHAKNPSSAKDRQVVRPNIDTLYSIAYFDLKETPIVFDKPATDIYSSAAVFDAYTNCVAVLGTGGQDDGKAAVYALCGPGYDATASPLPADAVKISVPTNMAWMIVRTEYEDANDLADVYAIQAKMSLVPLGEYGTPYEPPPALPYDPALDYVPFEKLRGMGIEEFFNTFNDLAGDNTGTPEDAPALAKYKPIGVGPGEAFDLTKFSTEEQAALRNSPAAILNRLANSAREEDSKFFTNVNNWSYPADHIARFGTDYEFRAAIAVTALGANPVEMAIYPTTTIDGAGALLDGNHAYTIRFDNGLPPCGAFWSITAYDEDGFLVDNPLNKYAIRNKDAFTQNPDGSTTFYLQPESPGADLAANWLPVPRGPFQLTMRIYQPDPAVLDLSWKAPFVVRASGYSNSGVGCDAGAGALGAIVALCALSARRLFKKKSSLNK